MLDDLQYIHEKDAQDALGIASKQADQYLHDYGFQWQAPWQVQDVVVAGMGGSSLAARAFKQIPGLKTPFELCQNYNLPPSCSANTLLICSSYSGNTEETNSALGEALARPEESRPMIVVVAAGGKLEQIANENNLPFVKIPSGFQPRYTFGYQYRALAEIFAAAGLIEDQRDNLARAAESLRSVIAGWVPDVPTTSNPAKQLALELMGKSIVVYSGPVMIAAAYKWKISFNENAKAIAWWNTIPEFNHNEFLGWTKHPEDKPYAVVDLHSSFDHPQVTKRFDITDRLLSGMRPAAHAVVATGESELDQMIYLVAMGDFVSLYLALVTGQNPTPVEIIEKLKVELA